MIQRIQTVYLFISIICLSVVTFGITILTFEAKNGMTILNSFGLQEFDKSNKSVEIVSYPYYASTIALILLCVLTILSYKNLKNQLKLIRMILAIYLFLVISLIAFSFSGNSITGQVDTKQIYGLGFYFFIGGLPFIFLANLGVKKDKNLLDSLNRLR